MVLLQTNHDVRYREDLVELSHWRSTKELSRYAHIPDVPLLIGDVGSVTILLVAAKGGQGIVKGM